ncbi:MULTISPECIES: toll/interleukin-1 receptor domain-containing protein [Streptacidiphilus]|uniref:Toll/interleukin-1 receptor domain-containing protein n=1 Tax=Streptacidiphilus cavernicola TaxID=3342716 RepID=A0ABV6UFN3_9ACTN|nr:toll/interleukin-1 receptor domain-containing protein [Streptacidiphilus jeojiense]
MTEPENALTGPERARLTDAMVTALQDIPELSSREARALLVDAVGGRLGRRLSLREQPTARTQLLELFHQCSKEEDGVDALAEAVSALAGRSRATEDVRELAGAWRRAGEAWTSVRFTVERTDAGDRDRRADGTRPPPPMPMLSSPPHRTAIGRIPAVSSAAAPAVPPAPDRWDFFISYTGVDRGWAVWIAWQLEEAGYRTLIQEWDIVPGSNWYAVMERGVQHCERTIALLSPAYLDSAYGSQERQAAQRQDPGGLARKLVPIRIAPCDQSGLLGGVVSFDLFDLSPDRAREVLLEKIAALLTGRSKPHLPPAFPA